ncbi:MAG: NlpC/P60 family protein [Chlorobi bacterium]|nr:NlpC/P60 family protein [Chlorobiota bacterium]
MMYRHAIPLSMGILTLVLQGCLPASRTVTTGAAGGYSEARRTLEQSRALPSLGRDRRMVLDEAETWLGTPYQFGGVTRSGVDCSGFVCNVFRVADRRLPRNSGEQAQVGSSVNPAQVLPGDLVFFNTSGSGVSHVGIMVDRDSFIHASTSSGVIVSRLSESYYSSHFLFIKRVLN